MLTLISCNFQKLICNVMKVITLYLIEVNGNYLHSRLLRLEKF